MYKWKLTKNVDCFEHNLNVPNKGKEEKKPANRNKEIFVSFMTL